MTPDLELALDAAFAGAETAMEHFARLATIEQRSKDDGTVVTDADVATETAVRDVLAAARPADGFLGEETGAAASTSGRRWILDGIDGTSVFVEGDDRWLSLIALEIDGRIDVGVAIVPVQQTVWFAARGHGAFRQGFDDSGLVGTAERLSSAGHTTPSGLRHALLPPLERVGPERFEFLRGVLADGEELHWHAHPALMVAAGELDVGAVVGGKLWDAAPFAVILDEAGGRACSTDGTPVPCDGPYLFTSTPELATAFVARIADE